MVAKNYIADGYTEDGLINAIPNMHGPVRFQYRVMLSDKIRELIHAWDMISAAERTRRTHAVIIKQVVSWDLVKEDPKTGEETPLPITAESLTRLKRNIVERLFNIVMQLETTDEETKPEEDLDLDKLLSDKPTEEEDAKN